MSSCSLELITLSLYCSALETPEGDLTLVSRMGKVCHLQLFGMLSQKAFKYVTPSAKMGHGSWWDSVVITAQPALGDQPLTVHCHVMVRRPGLGHGFGPRTVLLGLRHSFLSLQSSG